MAEARKRNGYIKGKAQLEFINPAHYRRAIGCSDIQNEEYWVQSVLHSKDTARHLTNEIFQKKRRNRVTNKIDPKSVVEAAPVDMEHSIRSKERKKGVKYSRVAVHSKCSPTVQVTPDVGLKVREIILEIAEACSDIEVKVLAYLVVNEQLDQRVIRHPSEIEELGAFGEAIQYIWDNKINNINSLNRYIGSKYASDHARKSLAKLVKSNFGYLTKII